MTRRLGGIGSRSLSVLASLSLRLFVVAMMLVMPAGLLGCGGDDNNPIVSTMEAGTEAAAPDAASDAASDAHATIDANDGGGNHVVDAEAGVAVKTLISVQVTPPSATLHLAATQQYAATANYSDGTTTDVSATATWSSADSTIATVSATGLVTATMKSGSTTVTATITVAGVQKAGSAAVIVSPAALSSVSVTPATATIPAGSTQQFDAKATYADNTTVDVTSQATWASATAATATISNLGLASGLAAGTSNITAAFNGQTGTAMLTVSTATLVSISVSPASGTTSVGGSDVHFTANAVYSDNTNHDVTTAVAWTSSSTATATIGAATGIAHAVAAGSSTITATYQGKTATAGLAVTGATLTSVTVTPPTATIPGGTTQQFTATATFSDGTTQNVSSSASWQSSAPTIATVSTIGVATGVMAGNASITAAFGGMTSAAATLNVTVGLLQTITISPASPQFVPLGLTVPFTATGAFSDGTSADISALVTWSSTPAGFVSFTGSTATGSAAGVTTVTASMSGKTSNGTAVTVTTAVLQSIAVTPTAPATLHVNATQAFAATGTFSDTTTHDITGSVVWASSVPATATITSGATAPGVATGVANGTTSITAASGTITSPAVVLNVNPATLVTITLHPSALTTLPVGQTQPFTATGTYSDGTTGDVTATVTWDATDNSGTATPDFTAVNGLVTAVSSTAALPGGGGFAAGQGLVRAHQGAIVGVAPIKVTATTITGINVSCTGPNFVSPGTLTCIPAGQGFSIACTAIATFSDSTTSDITATASWSSSTTATATAAGLANGQEIFSVVGAGSTNAIATQGGQTSPAAGGNAITAQTETISNTLAITNGVGGLSVGQTNGLGATASYAGTGVCAGTVSFVVTSLATWQSSDTTIATVSNATATKGLVTAIAAGTATISADFQGQSGNFGQTVNGHCLQSIAIDQVAPTYPQDVFVPLTVKGFYSDAPTVGVQLSSSSSPGNTGIWSSVAVTATSGAWQLNTGAFGGGPLGFAIAGGCSGPVIDSTTVTIDTTTLPTGVTVTPATSTINLGATVDYTATATYPTYGPFSVALQSTWSTTPVTGSLGFGAAPAPSLAERLTHTGTTAGSYTITAVYRNQTGTASLTVSGTHTVTAIAVSSAVVGTLPGTALDAINGAPVGLPITFGVTVNYSDGLSDHSLTGVTFASATAGVLSGFTGNVATTTTAGTTNVTASVAGFTSANQAVIVNANILTSISASPGPVTIPENTTQALSITGTYNLGAQLFHIEGLVTSQSANTTVATVTTTPTGTSFTTKAVASAVVLSFLKDGVTGTDNVTVAGTCVTAITVTPATVTTLPIGSTQAFTAMATASDGTSSDATGVVAWGPASDGTVVNNGGGSFTGAAAGSDMITATLTGLGVCAGGNAATTTVVGTASLTVTPAAVASITVDTAPTGGLVELPSGESRQLQVLATLTDGTTNVDVTSLATFVAGAPSIASVSATGLVTGNTAGVGSINVSYAPTSVTATPITFTVETCGMPLVGINEVGGNIAVGQSELFTATAVYGTPAGCTATLTERTFDATAGAAWASSNTTAATIVSGGANAGKLTALAAGTTNVTAAYKGGTSPIVVVTPIAVTLSTLTITAGGTVPKGGSETVTVAALWSDGGHYPAPPVSWAVADNTVLTIDGSNVLHGVAVGSTTYVAQSGSVTSNTLTGNVSAACISSITLSSPTGTTLPVGVPFTVAFSCTTSDNSVLPCAPLFGTTGADIDTAFFTGSAAFATSGQARIGATGAGTVTATISAVNGGCGLGVAATPLAITGGTATLQRASR